MKLTMLGTGNAGVKNLYNTCFALSEGENHFLVDAGGGNRILKILDEVKIPLTGIHDIFVTHEHVDHLLGVIWLIRMVGQKMGQDKYGGDLRIYCHRQLADVIRTITQMTIQKKLTDYFDDRIKFIPLNDGDTRQIISCEVTFFDIGSTKARQFGFMLRNAQGQKITCCGDEPYNECEADYVKDSDWLLHEAFCLYQEADKFLPYEKHHSTVKEACELAAGLEVPNLILYHTEETHGDERKKLYTAEGKQFYRGNLYVPDDLEVIELLS